MDIVQRKEELERLKGERERLISASIWPIWTRFKANLDQVLQSYEKSGRPAGWSARLDSAHDRSLVIIQNRGLARDGHHEQKLAITVSVRERDSAAITVATEDYIVDRNGRHASQNTKKWEYLISLDPESGEPNLICDLSPMAPSQAVDDLIEKTILKDAA